MVEFARSYDFVLPDWKDPDRQKQDKRLLIWGSIDSVSHDQEEMIIAALPGIRNALMTDCGALEH